MRIPCPERQPATSFAPLNRALRRKALTEIRPSKRNHTRRTRSRNRSWCLDDPCMKEEGEGQLKICGDGYFSGEPKKRSSQASRKHAAWELLSPDLRCFWEHIVENEENTQEYLRAMTQSNSNVYCKVISPKDRAQQVPARLPAPEKNGSTLTWKALRDCPRLSFASNVRCKPLPFAVRFRDELQSRGWTAPSGAAQEPAVPGA